MEAKLTTKIKEYRAKKNLTQERLAEIVNVRRETIVFVEQGRYVPSLKLAYDIAKFFGVPIEQIFFFKDSH
jgi:putative transcriptional regulator